MIMFVSHWRWKQDSSRLKKKIHCPHCGSWCESWHTKCCYAKHKRCYKCRRRGHIVRVCGRQDPAGEAVKDQHKAIQVAVKSKVKSPSRQARDRRRYAAFMERKNEQSVFPFLHVHDMEIPQLLDQSLCIKQELKTIKEKLNVSRQNKATRNQEIQTHETESDDKHERKKLEERIHGFELFVSLQSQDLKSAATEKKSLQDMIGVLKWKIENLTKDNLEKDCVLQKYKKENGELKETIFELNEKRCEFEANRRESQRHFQNGSRRYRYQYRH